MTIFDLVAQRMNAYEQWILGGCCGPDPLEGVGPGKTYGEIMENKPRPNMQDLPIHQINGGPIRFAAEACSLHDGPDGVLMQFFCTDPHGGGANLKDYNPVLMRGPDITLGWRKAKALHQCLGRILAANEKANGPITDWVAPEEE